MDEDKNSRGLALVAIILAVLILGLGFGAYKFIFQKQSSSSEKNFVEESLVEESSGGSETPNQNEFGSGQVPNQSDSGRGSEVAEDEAVLPQNFSETGGLTDWDANAEKQTGNWVLLYDKPGQLALTVKLTFDNESICDFGSGEEKCDFSKFELGMFAKVEGYEKDGTVTVVKITKQTTSQ